MHGTASKPSKAARARPCASAPLFPAKGTTAARHDLSLNPRAIWPPAQKNSRSSVRSSVRCELGGHCDRIHLARGQLLADVVNQLVGHVQGGDEAGAALPVELRLRSLRLHRVLGGRLSIRRTARRLRRTFTLLPSLFRLLHFDEVEQRGRWPGGLDWHGFVRCAWASHIIYAPFGG